MKRSKSFTGFTCTDQEKWLDHICNWRRIKRACAFEHARLSNSCFHTRSVKYHVAAVKTCMVVVRVMET